MYNPGPDQSQPEYPILLNFSANWCGPCKKVDWSFLLEEFPDLPVYKCDIDQNKYTPGFCGVRSIPSFVMLTGPKKVEGPEQMSDTSKIASWIFQTLNKNKKNK